MNLQSLIGESASASFWTEVWGVQTRRYASSSLAETRLISLDEIDILLSKLNRAHEGWLHLADQGLRAVPPQFVGEDGLLDMRKIRSAFAAGQTLYLTKAEKLVPGLRTVCRELAGDFVRAGVRTRQATNAHLFLTPPRTQGFAAHRDEHASFILQLEGEKTWIVYEPEAGDSDASSFRTGASSPETLKRCRTHEFVLRAGDVLFMPEWWPHEARALDTFSLHATIRIFPLRGVDALAKASAVFGPLLSAIPRNLSKSDLAELLTSVVASSEFRKSAEEAVLEEDMTRSLQTLQPATTLRDVAISYAMSMETILKRRDELTCDLQMEGDLVVLSFEGGSLRGPSELKPVLQHVLRSRTLKPSELPNISADYDKLTLAQRLVQEGLMVIDSLP